MFDGSGATHVARSRPHRPRPPWPLRGRGQVQERRCRGQDYRVAAASPLPRGMSLVVFTVSTLGTLGPVAAQLVPALLPPSRAATRATTQRARLSPQAQRCQLGLPAPCPLPATGRQPRCATWPRPRCQRNLPHGPCAVAPLFVPAVPCAVRRWAAAPYRERPRRTSLPLALPALPVSATGPAGPVPEP